MTSGFTVLGDDHRATGYAIELLERSIEAPDGSVFTRDVVRHLGAVAVLPVGEAGTVHLLRQYRASVDRYVVEMPAGLRDHQDEDLEVTARRELLEEMGLVAEHLEFLACVLNSSGFCDQRTWLYLATGLSSVPPVPDGIEEQFVERFTMSLADLVSFTEADGSDVTLLLAAQLAARRLGI